AVPAAPVVVVGVTTLPESADQVTVCPGTPLPLASTTFTTSAAETVTPAKARWLSPDTFSTACGAAGRAVARKTANTRGWPVTGSTPRTSTFCESAVKGPRVQR